MSVFRVCWEIVLGQASYCLLQVWSVSGVCQLSVCVCVCGGGPQGQPCKSLKVGRHGSLQISVSGTGQLDRGFCDGPYEIRRKAGKRRLVGIRGAHHGTWLWKVGEAVAQSQRSGQMNRLNRLSNISD